MRGANCWTDHHMVRARVRILFFHARKHPVPFVVHKFSRPGTVNEYVASMEGR